MEPNADQAKASESEPGSKPNAANDLKSLPMPELQAKLGSSPDGLSQAEAQKRLSQYGPNEIEEKKTNLFLKFLTYFWGPIPWMIEAAVILSAVARHWPDFVIILLLLLANAVVGFWEEHQAGNAIAALKAKLAVTARVKRDGKWTTPAARELVPGDVIRVRLGDIVPADARLLDGDQIEVDQSALTGESLPATRKPGEAVFSGSIIRQGEIGALVYATGANTYFGKTAQLVQEATTVSHFQRAVLKIGDYLIILAVTLVVLILGVALFRGDPILTTLQFALVLTVAAIPVAMPTVLSVTMAVGARLLAKKEAIVTRLAAVEELAGVDVLCADKTGTLTQNKLTLGDPCRSSHPQCRAGVARGQQGHHRPSRAGRPEKRSGLERVPRHSFSAVRFGAQAYRGERQGGGRKRVQGHQGRAAGDPRVVGQYRGGEARC
jgi:H+-transporting ATPase